MFYTYEWYIKNTKEIIYVGKGCKRRYKTINKNKMFRDFVKRFDCESRILEYFDNEKLAFEAEQERIKELKSIGQAVCNIYTFSTGGVVSVWTEERRRKMSLNNPMKRKEQKERMSKNNPMKRKDIALKVNSYKMKKVFIGKHIFKSGKEAAKYFKVDNTSIVNWCKAGKRPKTDIICGYIKENFKDNQQLI